MNLETSQSRNIAKDRWIALGVIILLGALTWLVFGQTFHFEFINFDDGAYVEKNPQVNRGLTTAGVLWAFTHFHSGNWHPLTWLSHMLDCQFFGLNAGWHHLTNVALHAAAAILLFLVLRQMTGFIWRSAFVAAIFAIHPLRVESVAWVAERKDILSGLFFVLTLGAYAKYARQPSARRYCLVLVLFVIGLMAKPMLVTLPVILLLLDYWPLNRLAPSADSSMVDATTPRKLILEKLPLLGLAAASSIVTLFAQKVALQPLTNISIPIRIGNALMSCVIYLRQFFWPFPLAAFYPFVPDEVVVTKVVVAAIVLAVISVAIVLLRRHRYLVTGWLWYLVMLGPVIGILQVGNQAHADRYTYLPHIGIAVLLTWTVADLLTRWKGRGFFLGPLAIALIALLSWNARTQAAHWQNSESLWAYTLSITPNNALAEENLAETLHQQGRGLEAIPHLEKAIRLDPYDGSVHSLLGVTLLEGGDAAGSLSELQTAIQLDPHDADAQYNIANTLMALGQPADAVAHYNEALKLNPDDVQSLNNMAWILATWPDALVRDGAKALALAERAVSLTNHRESRTMATFAAAFAEIDRFPDAVATAERAAELAQAEGNSAFADFIRGQADLYRSHVPFRDHRYSTGR
jgi:tetratricopeptide (TPR) repeat protein